MTLWRAHRDTRLRPPCESPSSAREDGSPGYRSGMADDTVKRKAPLATGIVANVAIGLLAIGIAVL